MAAGLPPDTLHVRPAAGLRVLDPTTFEPLPAEGCAVPATTYWFRRLADGDVSLVETAPEPTSKTKTTPRSKA